MALYESIADYYDQLFPLKKIRIAFLDSLIGDRTAHILDIGCATGELALALAKKGHHVKGIDLNLEMIELAREKVKKENVGVDFFIKDMIRVGEEFLPDSLDVVLCFGNTLAHLENLEKINIFLKGVRKILKCSGFVVLQVVNFERVFAGKIHHLPLLENSNFSFKREYYYKREQHCIDFFTYFKDKKSGKVIENIEKIYPLTYSELKDVLLSIGYSKLRFLGNEAMDPFDKLSPALITIAFV